MEEAIGVECRYHAEVEKAVRPVIDNIAPAESSNSPPDAAQRPAAGIRDDIVPDNGTEPHNFDADKSVLRQPVILNQMAGAWRAAPAWRAPGNQYPYVEALDRAVPHGDVGVPPGRHAGAECPRPGWEIAPAVPVAIVREIGGVDIDRAAARG